MDRNLRERVELTTSRGTTSMNLITLSSCVRFPTVQRGGRRRRSLELTCLWLSSCPAERLAGCIAQ
eukprot:3605976-Amphidinium_carterae.1